MGSEMCIRDRYKEEYFDIVGPICETTDVITENAKLNKGIKRGDLLFIEKVGAYGATMSSTYNSRGLIPEVLVSKNMFFEIRKKMKDIVSSLSIPKEMSVILRTAGSERTKSEIKRDYEYLYKLWQNIKSKTLESIAPLLIHEENNIIKRALRDYFSTDFIEILIEV